jgi:hypothetical protein
MVNAESLNLILGAVLNATALAQVWLDRECDTLTLPPVDVAFTIGLAARLRDGQHGERCVGRSRDVAAIAF